MPELNEARILFELRRRLSSGRYRHTLAVADLAERLARRHGVDPHEARLAGLLHDWAKELSGARLAAYVKRHRVRVPLVGFIKRHAPHLLHGYVSAHMVSRRLGVRNSRILAAIAHHTLGRLKMSPLEKVLYVADLASPDREFAEAGRVRSLARRDLESAFREAVKTKIHYVTSQDGVLHPLTVDLWNHVCKN